MTSLKEELKRLYEVEGRLTPDLVLDSARHPDSPMHSWFEWDDGVAAEAWRREQARLLIRKQRVVYADADGRTVIGPRRYHAIRASDDTEFDFYDEADIRSDPFKKKLLLKSMERDWRQMEQRYGELVEFWTLVKRHSRRRKAS